MEISRSEQKRRVQEVGKLVVELAGLPPAVLSSAPCGEEIRALLKTAATLSGGARQRHLKYLTKLLKTEPLDELYAYISRHRGKGLTERKQFRELEQYRDALINEAIEEQRHCAAMQVDWEEHWHSRTLVELAEKMPEIDVPALTRLASLFARTRNPRHSREIFRSLRAALEQHQRANTAGR
jgi:ribosome-associated protein